MLYYFLYIVCVFFVLSGALNYGFSKYFMAIPFMVSIVWISKYKLKSKKLFYLSVFLIIFSIFLSKTQTKNPLLYPIISDGKIEILEDGYYAHGSIYSEEEKNILGGNSYIKLNKGESYNVIGISISHADFGKKVNLITEIGQFNERGYNPTKKYSIKYISTNKKVQSVFSEYGGILMLWPMIPILILDFVDSIPDLILN